MRKNKYYFDLPHESTGNAKLFDFDKKSFIVSNIGRTGKDGLNIGLESLEFWEGSFSFVPTEVRQADSSVVISVTGDTSIAKSVTLFNIRYYLGGDGIVINVDNSGLEPKRQIVQVLKDDAVVEEVTLDEMAFTIDLPPAKVVRSTFKGGCRFEFWKRNKKVEQSFRFRESLSISISDGEEVKADRLNIIPDYKSFDTEKFLRLEAFASSIQAIIVFDEITKMPEDWEGWRSISG